MFEQQNFMNNQAAGNPQFSDNSRLMKVIKTNNSSCPAIKNHSAVFYNNNIYIFGEQGYDSTKNHNELHIFSIQQSEWRNKQTTGKQQPEGRNGHTATVVDNKMYIIGGWLGQGTHASKEVYVLDLDRLQWSQVLTRGDEPGPCNMHSADLIGHQIYIFRGGDGRDYLNDLHTFNIITNTWKLVEAEEDCPPPRANHCSAVVRNKLFIFGGWDGVKRLNDLFAFDTETNKWQEIKTQSPPSARAGMSMVAISEKLFMFGGSGPQSTCFQDLQIYDTTKNLWGMADIGDDEGRVKARAGHSMTAVGDKIYIFGGSFGQNYHKDFFIIETDAAPEIKGVSPETTQNKLMESFKKSFNNRMFSDITFNVQGNQFYGHKLILSSLCEQLAVTFQSEMKESKMDCIEIYDTNYEVFKSMMWFLYSGEFTFQEQNLMFFLELLQLSDQFIIDDLKMQCEKEIQHFLTPETLTQILNWSEQCNAPQLKRYCEWYQGHMKKQY